MSEIKRYDPCFVHDHESDEEWMSERMGGRYALYSDHQALQEKKDALIQQLVNALEGFGTGSWLGLSHPQFEGYFNVSSDVWKNRKSAMDAAGKIGIEPQG